ncbi:threonine synthase-like 1 [Branchiostoma floridae x Branchiostoma japonicum]
MVWRRLYSRLRCSQKLLRLSSLQLRNCSSDGAAGSITNRKGKNIILMGSPGAGKTTVGRILARMLDKPLVDIDNDHLESYWGIPVAEQLSRLGPDSFLQAEGEALLNFTAEDCVISLSGSNPMHQRAMKHITTLGTVVFLDVPSADILHRLEVMKVNRIVGQGPSTDMADILRYWQQFYEGRYDIRVLCGNNESAKDIARKVQEVLTWHENSNKYISTRQSTKEEGGSRTFSEVVLEGLAPDGGLYVPKQGLRCLQNSEWDRLVQCSYQERALRILEQCIPHTEVHPSVLNTMVQTAYAQDRFATSNVVPLVQLDNNQHVMELFHGPTASFKDLALQLMPQLYAEFSRRRSEGRDRHRSLILVATSGDTGSAVLDGFSRLPEALQQYVAVMVLYPEDGISPIQKAQMTANQADNVHVVGVQSDFDFCQSTVKSIFKQLSGSSESSSGPYHSQYGVHLSAANSINWGRLLPQVVYHASVYLDLVRQGTISMGQEVDVCIPTGNFGNILGAVYAKRMGIPFKRFVCASNQNNVLTDFLTSGCYDLRHRSLHRTMSPSIDILVSSNLERFLHLLTGDGDLIANMFHQLEHQKLFKVPDQILSQLQKDFNAGWCHEEDCAKTIQTIFQSNGYLLDPHTAVAKTVADRLTARDHPMLLASTAHYCKFAPDVLTALGTSLPTNSPVALFQALQALNPRPFLHGQLSKDIERPKKHKTVLEADRSQVITEMEGFMRRYFGK